MESFWYMFIAPAFWGGLAGFFCWRCSVKKPLSKNACLLIGAGIGVAPRIFGYGGFLNHHLRFFFSPPGNEAFVNAAISLFVVHWFFIRWKKLRSPRASDDQVASKTGLTSKKWSTAHGKTQFAPNLMLPSYTSSVFRATYSSGGAGDVYARVCICCENVTPLDQCSNCDYDGFVPGVNPQGIAGIFCFKCETGFTSWICEECKTENPVRNSLGKEQGRGCFIATAVYGEGDCEELLVLKTFRDEYLLRTVPGRQFVAGYYRVSPPLADLVRKYRWLGHFVRLTVVQPSVVIAQAIVNSNKGPGSGKLN